MLFKGKKCKEVLEDNRKCEIDFDDNYFSGFQSQGVLISAEFVKANARQRAR